jgi:hypothetical protein
MALVFMPAGIAAQDQQSRAAQRAETCRRSVQIVRDDAPSDQRKEALSRLSTCGAEGGSVLASELRGVRTTPDSVLQLKTYYQVARILDAEVLSAALDVAGDPQAAVEARIVSFKLLISYKNRHLVSLAYSGFLPGNPMPMGVQDHYGRLTGTPLPPNWEDEASSLLRRLHNDPAENDTIRFAARRALTFFRNPTK